LRQEDAATRARAVGLSSWIRGTIAQAEVGARRLTFEEVLLLAMAYDTTPAALVVGADSDLVELAPRAVVPAGTLRELLSGRVAAHSPTPRSKTPSRMDRAVDSIGDAERHAARRLGATAVQINEAAARRWGRSLADERDARVAERATDPSPRQLQALRGHVTRVLLGELALDLRRRTGQASAARRRQREPQP
jgi:hypothetical protein